MSDAPALSWRKFIKIHPATECFPLMSPGDLATLAADVKSKLKVPIEMRIVDGIEYLIDGRNRLDALELSGETIVDEHGKWVGKVAEKVNHKIATAIEVCKDVVSLNLHRRHLNIGQLAIAAENMANVLNGSNRYGKRVGSLQNKAITRDEAAKMFGIGQTSIDKVRQIKRNAPDLIKDIQSGERKLNETYQAVKKRKHREHKVAVEPTEPHEMFHEYEGNACRADRILNVPMERVYNSIARYRWGLKHFLIELEKSIGQARVTAIAKRATQRREKIERMGAKVLKQNAA
jgi:hypothetical protein